MAAMSVVSEAAFADTQSDEASFLSLINRDRAANGLSQLEWTPQLVDVARVQSARQAQAGTIFHNANLASEVTGNWVVLGENVGMGGSVGALHDAFMNSPHHRDNVLGDYDRVGIGIVMGGADNATIFVTEVFWKTSPVKAPAVVKARATRRVVRKRVVRRRVVRRSVRRR
jgi:uncharacterized protein YkwD